MFFHLRSFLLFTILFKVAYCNDDFDLVRRDPCTISCPLTDDAFYPLGTGSGPSSGVLVCTYPFLSHCNYDSTDGSLTRDRDASLCPTSAICSSSSCSCPSRDLGNYALGLGSEQHGSVLFCSYPTTSQTLDTSSYCEYSMTNGTQMFDNDAGLCPITAVMQGSCSSVTTSPLPPPAPPASTLVPSTTIPTTTPITSIVSATVPIAATVSATTSTNKRITAIAVGSSVGALALLGGGGLLAWLLLRKNPQPLPLPSPPMSAAPLYPGGAPGSWQQGPNSDINAYTPPPQSAYSPPPGDPYRNPYSPPPNTYSPPLPPTGHTYSPPPGSGGGATYYGNQPSTDPSLFSHTSGRPNLPEL